MRPFLVFFRKKSFLKYLTNDHWSLYNNTINYKNPMQEEEFYMPTESFYKLDEEKRSTILHAMKKEFSRVPFHEASVNRIVEEAGISKGSFWVYFESKEEAIEYLIKTHLEKERKKAKQIFLKNKGDLFQSYLELYDYLAKRKVNRMEKDLMANIFKNLLTNEEKCLYKEPGDDLIKATKNIVNTENLNLIEEDLIDFMKILNYVMRRNLLDSITKKVTPERARSRLIRELEILKKGISKERSEEDVFLKKVL